MNKFLVVFTTTTAMVLLLCPNALSADYEIDFSVPLYADFTLQLPTGSGLPLNLDIVASSLVSLQAKSKIDLPTILKDIVEEQVEDKSCPINITPQRLDNTDTVGATFPPVNIIDLGGSDTIVDGAPVSIKFTNMHNCTGSPVWQVVNDTVQTGGTLGKDKFKITKVDEELAEIKGAVYKIQSCPSNSNSDSCQDLSLSLDPVTASTIVTTAQSRQTSPLHVQIKRPSN